MYSLRKSFMINSPYEIFIITITGLCFLLSQKIFAQKEPNVNPPTARGIYAVWYNKNKEVLNLPFIKGGQIVVQWADVEPIKGQYDFREIDKQMEWFNQANKMATIEVNGNKKPGWDKHPAGLRIITVDEAGRKSKCVAVKF